VTTSRDPGANPEREEASVTTRPSRTMTRLRHAAGLVVTIGAAAAALGACSSPGPGAVNAKNVVSSAPVSLPAKPSHPVTLNILDIAGNLQLTQGMIQNFVKANPGIVSGVTYSKSPAPDMSGKLQAQERAHQVQTDLVLSGTDGLSAGIANHLLVKLLPAYGSHFPGLMGNYLPPAAAMQGLAGGYGVELVYYPSGPLLEYNPKTVAQPPTTPAALLAWAKAHPGKFEYAEPANSGPGRTLLMGLPYLLRDTNPRDPVSGWSKTWSYLQQLGHYVKYYPSGTAETMQDLANGSADMIASTTGWDIDPRALGTVPAGDRVALMQPMHWVTDAQYGLIPKGVSKDVFVADLDLLKWMLRPDQQAIAYDDGYFYPGPAVKGVSLAMAPAKSQQVIRTYGRSQYPAWIAQYPKQSSLPATQQVAAFDRWDRLVGGGKKG
jgi:putative spermidine/putrescine transport system substrate-binding protein